jgi:hypothetical protein
LLESLDLVDYLTKIAALWWCKTSSKMLLKILVCDGIFIKGLLFGEHVNMIDFFGIFYWHMAHNITWNGRIFFHVSKDKQMKMDEQKMDEKLNWMKFFLNGKKMNKFCS